MTSEEMLPLLFKFIA